jgi:sarcosine oxidase subunit beta
MSLIPDIMSETFSTGGAHTMARSSSTRKNFDIIVIGGGMTGCATAYYLAKGGMDVALVEKRAICSGASGRNGGQVIQVEGRDELTTDLIEKKNSIGYHGKKMLDSLSDELELDIEFRKTGGLDLAYSDEDERVIKQVIDWQWEVGDRGVEYIGASEIQDLYPVFGDELRGGKIRRDDGNANPFKITYGFALAAQRLGVSLFTYTTVREIIYRKEKAVGVKTDGGDLFAGHGIVNASNAWSKFLFPEYPIVPCKILAFVTEQLPVIPLPPTETVVFDLEGDAGYGVEDDGAYLFFGGSQVDGNVIIGGPPVRFPESMDDHFNETVYYEDFMRFRTLFSRYWPHISGVSLIRGWGGALGFTPDALPLVGPTRYENLYMNAGFTNGMCWCPICGKLMAEYILDKGKTSLPIDMMNPERFSGEVFEWPERFNYTVLHNYIHERHG